MAQQSVVEGAGRDLAARTAGASRAVSTTAIEQSHKSVSSATGEARHLVMAVKAEAGQVGDEVREQARALVEDSKVQLLEQAELQTDRIVQSLRRLGHEAGALVSGRPDEAEILGRYLKQAATKVDQLADEVELRGIVGLVEDAEDFARRRPGVFLAATAVAGFGIGRLLKASSGASGGR